MAQHFYSPSVSNLDGVFKPMNPFAPDRPTPPEAVMSLDSGYGITPETYANTLNGGLQDVASAFQLMDMFLFRP